VLLHPDVRHRPTAEEAEELLSAVARGETPLGGPAEDTVLAPAAGRLGNGAIAGGLLGAAGAAAFAAGQRTPSRGYYDEAPVPAGNYSPENYSAENYNAGYGSEPGYDENYGEGYETSHAASGYHDPRYASEAR